MVVASLDQFVQGMRHQIREGEAELALDQLQAYVQTNVPDLYDETLLLAGRYRRLSRDGRRGIVAYDMIQAERSRLDSAMLDLIIEVSKKVKVGSSPVATPTLPEDVPAIPKEVKLEKILGVNNLKQISWLARGLEVSKSVCRVLTPTGLGSGFLIAADLLMTNNHVLPCLMVAQQSIVEFNYQHDFAGNVLPACRYKLDTSRFCTNTLLDYAIVGVSPEAKKPELGVWGHTAPNAYADPVPGEHVIIIQHPNGGLKQIALTANQVVGRWEHRLHYTTDTMPGSSGAPVFNDQWQVIAIHHGGGDLQVNQKGDKRFINEGILMSAIRSDAGSLWPE